MAWYSEIEGRQWRTLWAAQMGWMLDAMDVMLYAFALTAVRQESGRWDILAPPSCPRCAQYAAAPAATAGPTAA